jgi:hypothetical protein
MGGDNQPRLHYARLSGAPVDDSALVATCMLDELRERARLPYRCAGDRCALEQQSIEVFAAYGPAPAALGRARRRRQLGRHRHIAGIDTDAAHWRSGNFQQRTGNA